MLCWLYNVNDCKKNNTTKNAKIICVGYIYTYILKSYSYYYSVCYTIHVQVDYLIFLFSIGCSNHYNISYNIIQKIFFLNFQDNLFNKLVIFDLF